MITHRHDHPDSDHVSDQSGTALADERQRNPGQRKQADIHPDVFKYVEQNHHDDASRDIRIKFILSIKSYLNHLEYQKHINENQQAAADKPKILANYRENHVGFTNRNINVRNVESFP